jgi:hypothetical protein
MREAIIGHQSLAFEAITCDEGGHQRPSSELMREAIIGHQSLAFEAIT